MKTTLNLEEIRGRASDRRWPTVAEIGDLRGDNLDLCKEVERLYERLAVVEKMAAAWEERAAHDVERSKQIPETVADATIDIGTQLLENARALRRAVDVGNPAPLPNLQKTVEILRLQDHIERLETKNATLTAEISTLTAEINTLSEVFKRKIDAAGLDLTKKRTLHEKLAKRVTDTKWQVVPVGRRIDGNTFWVDPTGKVISLSYWSERHGNVYKLAKAGPWLELNEEDVRKLFEELADDAESDAFRDKHEAEYQTSVVRQEMQELRDAIRALADGTPVPPCMNCCS